MELYLFSPYTHSWRARGNICPFTCITFLSQCHIVTHALLFNLGKRYSFCPSVRIWNDRTISSSMNPPFFIKNTWCFWQLDAQISQIYFWNKNSTCFGQFLCPSSGVFHCTHSNGICHTGLLTDCEQYDIYHCCVYSEKLLMMDRGTVRNM